MTDMKPAMLSALAHLPACCALSFAEEEMALPIIVIGDELRRVHARADGQDYLEEYVANVDVYAAATEELESLCQDADAALSALGLMRQAAYDLYDDQAWAYRKHMRYRALIQGDTIYQ